jgi:hypothetical protein
MKKSSLIFIVFCCGLAFWQTNLSPGNIAIIGVNGDPPDEFLFVLLNNENLNAQICHPPDLTTTAELQPFPWYEDENDTSILDKKYDSLINL